MSDHAAHIAEYSKFYRENVERLVGFLILQGWTRLDAADCVQETLIAALPPTWATLDNPLAWCRKVAYRKACDLLRRSREEPVADLERAGTPLIVPGTELDALLQDDQFAGWLAKLRRNEQSEAVAHAQREFSKFLTEVHDAFTAGRMPSGLTPWIQVVESTEKRFGRTASTMELSCLSAGIPRIDSSVRGIRSLFNEEASLPLRFRLARRNARNVTWWVEQADHITSSDRAFI